MLAQAGAVDAVKELADVIALCAQGQAEQTPEVEGAAWEAGATAIGWGSSARLAAAKKAASRGKTGAADALCAAARQLRGDVAQAH